MHFEEVLGASDFTFKGTMAAIELMDPKVDAGMVASDATPSVSARLSDGSISFALPNETLLATMDRLLELLVSYVSGNSLPQTVFTCLYVHREAVLHMRMLLQLPHFEYVEPMRLKATLQQKDDSSSTAAPHVTSDAPSAADRRALSTGSDAFFRTFFLYSFCAGVLKVCNAIRDVILRSDLFEVRFCCASIPLREMM